MRLTLTKLNFYGLKIRAPWAKFLLLEQSSSKKFPMNSLYKSWTPIKQII